MNHQKEAAKIVESVENCGEIGAESTLNVALAQTHALLAVAEQLRVANLLNLGDIGDEALAYYDKDREEPRLLPEVAEALGIDQS